VKLFHICLVINLLIAIGDAMWNYKKKHDMQGSGHGPVAACDPGPAAAAAAAADTLPARFTQ
jgi:hypothetical protein